MRVRAAAGVGMLLGLVLLGVVVGRLVLDQSRVVAPPSSSLATVDPIIVGSVAEVASVGVVYLPDPPLFVVSHGGEFIALSANAQHIGGEQVRYCRSSGYFSSPFHGEQFDDRGRYAAGPARSDMDRYRVEVRDNVVLVHVAELQRAAGRSLVASAPSGPACSDDEGGPLGFYVDR